MSEDKLELHSKEVADMLIASIRFRGPREMIHRHLEKLHQQVQRYVNGKPLCLYHGGNARDGYELELCLPVSQPVAVRQIKSRTLEGGPMICATHTGPYGPPEAEGSLSKFWNRFYARLREKGVGLAEGPPREVYLESRLQHGEDAQRYVTELQEHLLLPRWLNRMARGLDRLAGEVVMWQVLQGSNKLKALSPASEKVHWVKGAMQRLDALVDEKARKEIMAGCAHIFPQGRIQQLRAEYLRLGDIDKLLEVMARDRSCGENSYYSAPKREGNIIYTTKIPFNPKGYQEATDGVEKRFHYCHCPLVKEAIREGQKISATFCYCGSGWFKRLWEGILGEPVNVEVLKTVLQGDDCCQFAIHLPAGE
jgi:effector-binding domain-containing protein